MVHISCDICGKQLQSGAGHHHVVKIEVFAARDPAQLTEDDLDADHMDEVSQLLDNVDDEVEDLDPVTRQFRYDLCCDCRRRFVRDPLSKELATKFDFSDN